MDAALDEWFLRADERGNDATDIDRRHGDGAPYTTGNQVELLVDGAAYFARLARVLCDLGNGDLVLFADWRGDGDEQLLGPGTEVGRVLADLVGRGVDVRGLVWRSHVDAAHFSEEENRELAAMVNAAGGEVLLDERVARAGCHHQKLVVVRHPDGDGVAFVGGIDLGHGRHDDAGHHGDPQAIDLDDRYGPRPRWHDAHVEMRGPAVGDVDHTFRERWNDPLRLDHRVPWRSRFARLAREPRRVEPLPAPLRDPSPCGPHAVQLLRTYPAKRPPFPFAPRGERSVARAYLKAFANAQSLVYLEDQYLWSPDATAALTAALRRAPKLHVIAVVPRYPDHDDVTSGPPQRYAQERAIAALRAAGGDRVAAYDLDVDGMPVYVHAKVAVVDDVWCAIGSDNLNRRSWTNDSELTCAVVDSTLDDREPTHLSANTQPRVFARSTRLRLMAEHLELAADGAVDFLADPQAAAAALGTAADALDAWHADGAHGARPSGRVRHHAVEPVPRLGRLAAAVAYRTFVDPDGRPRDLRRAGTF